MIELKNVSKWYSPNDPPAVNQLSLNIDDGEIFGFIGPNGAGKTTTIKMMTGMLFPNNGEILINGHDIVKDSVEAKRNFGYVPDTPTLFEKVKGIDYLNFISNIYDVPMDIREERMEKYSTALDLRDSLKELVGSYSHGMKQKLAVIGVLMYEPKVWILDEPLVGLDPQSAYTLKELMKEHAAKGNTVFFSSHILEVVEKLCHRVGIIQKGQLKYLDTIENMKAAYQGKTFEDIALEILKNE